MHCRNQKRTEKTGDHSADGDFVGDDEMFEVNEGGRDQAGEEQAIDEGEGGGLVADLEPASQEQNRGQELDQKIADRDGSAAIAAFAAEIKPGKERGVEVPGDGVFTMRTMGRRRHDALTERQPMYADVEKAPYDGTEGKQYERPEVEWNGGPIPRVEDRVQHERSCSVRGRVFILVIDMLFEGAAHDGQRGGPPGPD